MVGGRGTGQMTTASRMPAKSREKRRFRVYKTNSVRGGVRFSCSERRRKAAAITFSRGRRGGFAHTLHTSSSRNRAGAARFAAVANRGWVIRFSSWSWVALGVVLSSASLHAQPPSVAEQARALSNEGLEHFRQHEYEQAIASFQRSYAMSPLPALLFDMAQAYRLAGDCDSALQYYRRYGEVAPGDGNRDALDGRIRDMERCAHPAPPVELARSSVAAVVVAPLAIAAPPALVASESPALRVRRARQQEVGGLVLVGAGAAALAAAIYFTVDGAHAQATLQQQLRQNSQWQANLEQQTDARGRRDNIAAGVLFGVGGAMAAGGAILYGVGHRSERVVRVSGFVQPSGGMVACAASF